MAKSPDPTKDPEFQGVIQHFLKTPPKPHAKSKGMPKSARAPARKRAKSIKSARKG